MKLLPLLFLIFTLCGCTAKKLAINNADTLISYEVQKRLPVNSSQKKELDVDIVKFLNKTKPMAREVLPLIDNINLSDKDDVSYRYERLVAHYEKLSSEFTAIISKYMAKLDKDQQREFFETVDKDNRKFKAKSKETRFNEIESRYELFLGDIVPEQKKILEKYRSYFVERSNKRYEQRIKLREGFMEVYRKNEKAEQKESQFQKLFHEFHEQNMVGNKNIEILHDFIPTLAPRQKEFFREKSQEIQELVKYFMAVEY